MSHPVPPGALDKHIAILGKTGSGKSNLAKTIAEDLLARGARVCVIDPTGTWWGLRLMADGETPSGHPIVIFGGQHADLPVAAAHGEAIARAIGTSSTPAIIDTRQLTVSDRTRFFTGFAETLIQVNRGELTLIIDEAHLFAPQAGSKVGGGAPAMLHAANNLVSLGRGVGLRIILISQRPAKLHKDSLTQVETLVAMRLIAPQDRKAIDDWIGEWGSDLFKGRDLLSSLPSLPTGDAWVWSPEINHLERAHCPLAATYDSGRVRDGEMPDTDIPSSSSPVMWNEEISEFSTVRVTLPTSRSVPVGATLLGTMDALDICGATGAVIDSPLATRSMLALRDTAGIMPVISRLTTLSAAKILGYKPVRVLAMTGSLHVGVGSHRRPVGAASRGESRESSGTLGPLRNPCQAVSRDESGALRRQWADVAGGPFRAA